MMWLFLQVVSVFLLRMSTMGFQHISHDVKIAAIQLHEQDLLELDDILQCCSFSARTFYHILKLWCKMGDVVNPKAFVSGHIHILDHEDVQYLLCLVADNPNYFLDRLLHLLKKNQFILVHYTAVHHVLECANISRKKTQAHCNGEE
jgi:hypothetical protein